MLSFFYPYSCVVHVWWVSTAQCSVGCERPGRFSTEMMAESRWRPLVGTELGGNRKQIGNRLSQRLNNVPYTEVVSLILQNPAPCCLKQKCYSCSFDMLWYVSFGTYINSTNIRQRLCRVYRQHEVGIELLEFLPWNCLGFPFRVTFKMMNMLMMLIMIIITFTIMIMIMQTNTQPDEQQKLVTKTHRVFPCVFFSAKKTSVFSGSCYVASTSWLRRWL